jgi:5-methylcytosine-specific restriction endonuclease McrA
MPIIITYKQVKDAFESKGYKLLSTVYLNTRSKLYYECANGYRHSITFKQFKKCSTCPCSFKNAKLTYEHVRHYFGMYDYKLLSTSYINSDEKLRYACDKGHIHDVSCKSFKQGSRCPTCYRLRISGKNSNLYKQGVSKLNLPLYNTLAYKLENYQAVYKIVNNGADLLGVACGYCGNIFIPKATDVRNRVAVINGRLSGEQNLYCSENCKKACPTFGQIKYPKGFKVSTSREVQPQLRKLVLARDNYQCQICDAGIEEAELHCHHIDPVATNPIESADIDNCVTLCKDCHKHVHTLPGCNYNELKCIN